MNFLSLVIHSLAIISVFRNLVVIRSTIFILVYLFLILKNITALKLLPIVLLILFILYILKISMRANMEEFDKSLENIESTDILGDSNSG